MSAKVLQFMLVVRFVSTLAKRCACRTNFNHAQVTIVGAVRFSLLSRCIQLLPSDKSQRNARFLVQNLHTAMTTDNKLTQNAPYSRLAITFFLLRCLIRIAYGVLAIVKK